MQICQMLAGANLLCMQVEMKKKAHFAQHSQHPAVLLTGSKSHFMKLLQNLPVLAHTQVDRNAP